jgi:uncharacterized membrane protein
MTSLPLHPVIVHLPLAGAFVMPALALGFSWALWKGRIQPRTWSAIVVIQALLFGAGLVAVNTGEREEDRVERVVPEAALEQHEELAGQFLWATGGTLLLAGLVPVFRSRQISRSLSIATVVGTLCVAASAIRVGHAGARLVYEHNAGAAYSAPAPHPATTSSNAAEPRLARDDGGR